MNSFVAQVEQNGPTTSNLLFPKQYDGNTSEEDSDLIEYNGELLIHLFIEGTEFFITRDQLMALPESILLCLFPEGVFLDEDGDAITRLTPEDEVVISNFAPSCFQYTMDIYTKAFNDFTEFPFAETYNIPKEHYLSSVAKGFFGFGGANISEKELLHQKPVIVVLREDLDFYCVPNFSTQFDTDNIDNDDTESKNRHSDKYGELRDQIANKIMSQIKKSAGSHIMNQKSVFHGLIHSNKTIQESSSSSESETDDSDDKEEEDHNESDDDKSTQSVATPEKHLMDMLCSSGFQKDSKWGNRIQDKGKTMITSLSLCRIENETTDEFRNKYFKAKKQWDANRLKMKSSQESLVKLNTKSKMPMGRSISTSFLSKKSSSSPLSSPIESNVNDKKSIVSSPSHPILSVNTKMSTTNNSDSTTLNEFKDEIMNSPPSATSSTTRKSRFSRLTDNVRSRSSSKNRLSSKHEQPKLYDLVPKPDINNKLLLFWRKPARKCWWSEEHIDVKINIHGKLEDSNDNKILHINLDDETRADDLSEELIVPVKLHVRRVWTLELSVIGA